MAKIKQVLSVNAVSPREFPMTGLPDHPGNMSMQRHMSFIIKLVLVSQGEARTKDQMFA